MKYDSSTLRWVVDKVKSLEAVSGVASVNPATGTGNAITDIIKEGSGLTPNKGLTFSLSGHTHTFNSLTDKPTTIAGYGIEDAYTKTESSSLFGITKVKIEEVLTGNITSHSHLFSNITSKPTTIAGYGITDAYTKTQTDGFLALKLDVATFSDLFEKVNTGTELSPVYAIKAKYNFYSVGEVSAFGAGAGGTGGGGGGLIATVYGSTDLGGTFNDANYNDTFNAYSINEVYKTAYSNKNRILNLENGVYNKNETDARIAAVVNSAPSTLDTLNELANALGNDPNFATTTANLIGTKLSLSGGQLTGQLGLLQGAGGGISFPDNSFGGGGDSASIKLINPAGGESTEMTFTMTNDADDIINFSVPSIDGVKVNRYTVWNAGNFTNLNQLTTRNFNDLQNIPTTLSGYGITDALLKSDINIQVGGTKNSQMSWASWNNSDVYGGAIQIREYGYVDYTQSDWYYAPAITFHWGNRNVKRFGMRYDGQLAIDDNPILWSGNYSAYALPLSGGTLSGNLSINTSLFSTATYLILGQNDFNVVVNKGANSFYPNNTSGLVDLGLSYNRWRYLYTDYLCNSQNTPIHIDTIWHSGNDGSGSGLDADTLDGVHLQNILEKQHSGYSASGTATGWFRIGMLLGTNSEGHNCILIIKRNYYYTNNETYVFSISGAYGGGISITQLSGYANSRLIDKIRIDYTNSGTSYIELHISTSTTTNSYGWSTIGAGSSYTTWTAVSDTPVGTSYEFTTVNGCKSDRGFTGNIAGNASTATQLQNTRTIWGQNFNGTGNVDGTLSIRPTIGNYSQGIRIKPFNNWATILLGGTDLTADTGTSTNTWSIHNNNGNFYINRNASNANTGYELCNVGGNWGIGTNAPAYKLDVNGTLRATGAVTLGSTLNVASTLGASSIGVSNSDATTGKGLSLYGGPTIGKPTYGIMFAGTSTFGTHGSVIGYWATYFTMSNDTNRGWIFQRGSTNVASISGEGNAKFDGSVTANRYIASGDRIFTGYDSGQANSISCSNWFISNGTSGWFNATYGGGIYQNDSTYVRVYNNKAFWVDNNIVATGEITAFGASDIRLKSNIKQIDSALGFLSKVKTYEFDWNEKALSLNPLKTKKGAGVIAQELQNLDSDFVHSIYGDYLGVDYERFIPYLIGGVNEVADEVTILKKRVAELELEVKQLKK